MTRATGLSAVADWLDHDPEPELIQLYREATGRSADRGAARRCGLALMRMTVPTWRPGTRIPGGQVELVGRVYSYLLGDLRGYLDNHKAERGAYRRMVTAQAERRSVLLAQLRTALAA